MESEIVGEYPWCASVSRVAPFVQPAWAYFFEIVASVAELLTDKVAAAVAILRIIYDFNFVFCGNYYTGSCSTVIIHCYSFLSD